MGSKKPVQTVEMKPTATASGPGVFSTGSLQLSLTFRGTTFVLCLFLSCSAGAGELPAAQINCFSGWTYHLFTPPPFPSVPNNAVPPLYLIPNTHKLLWNQRWKTGKGCRCAWHPMALGSMREFGRLDSIGYALLKLEFWPSFTNCLIIWQVFNYSEMRLLYVKSQVIWPIKIRSKVFSTCSTWGKKH